jgi:hypothetical protein
MQIRSRVGVVSWYALEMSQTALTPGGRIPSGCRCVNAVEADDIIFPSGMLLPFLPKSSGGYMLIPAINIPDDCRNLLRELCFDASVLFFMIHDRFYEYFISRNS